MSDQKKTKASRKEKKAVECSLRGTFPASDPPSYWASTSPEMRRRQAELREERLKEQREAEEEEDV